MVRFTRKLFMLLSSTLISVSLISNANAGSEQGGATDTETEYKPQKVVYDVIAETLEELEGVLSRASYLSTITGADPFDQSIVLVSHGPEIHYFAIKNRQKHHELMQRARSLVESKVLIIRMCKVAAQAQGYAPKDIQNFVEMIPMGDAEIIRLQNEEAHAYMQ